jgi:hypothetical protein
MPPIWKPLAKEIYYQWIESLKDEAWEELNEWEQNFVTDIERRLMKYREYKLSEKQHEILERLYAEKTN